MKKGGLLVLIIVLVLLFVMAGCSNPGKTGKLQTTPESIPPTSSKGAQQNSTNSQPKAVTINESKELTENDMKIGKLFIGESLAKVQQYFGKPTVITIVHGNGAPQWEYIDQKFTVGGDHVFSINASGVNLGSTPRGIHIGSKEQDVRKAYPNAEWGRYNFPNMLEGFDKSKDGKYDIAFFISKNSDTLSRIILTNEIPSIY